MDPQLIHSVPKRFGFETTLSGRGYLSLVKRLKADGWRIELVYLALPSVELSHARVQIKPQAAAEDRAPYGSASTSTGL